MEDQYRDRLRFHELTRRQIVEEFKRQKGKQKDYRPRYGIDDDAESFVLSLENYAEAIPQFNGLKPPEHQRRREQLRSIALHFGELAQRLSDLDSAALGYLLHCGINERKKRTGEQSEELGPYETMVEAAALRDQVMPMLKDLGRGAQVAAKELPEHTYDVYLETALAVERLFVWNHKLKFSVSETGFAAMCLSAVYEAGGIQNASIKYWIKCASLHPKSMSSLIRGSRDRLAEGLDDDEDE